VDRAVDGRGVQRARIAVHRPVLDDAEIDVAGARHGEGGRIGLEYVERVDRDQTVAAEPARIARVAVAVGVVVGDQIRGEPDQAAALQLARPHHRHRVDRLRFQHAVAIQPDAGELAQAQASFVAAVVEPVGDRTGRAGGIGAVAANRLLHDR